MATPDLAAAWGRSSRRKPTRLAGLHAQLLIFLPDCASSLNEYLLRLLCARTSGRGLG